MFGGARRRRERFEAAVAKAASEAVSWDGEGLDPDGVANVNPRDLVDKAYELGREFVSEVPDAVARAASVRSYFSRKLGDWARAQAELDEGSALLDAAVGKSAPAAINTCFRLVEILLQREQFDRALAVLDDRVAHTPATSPDRLAIALERVRTLSAMGRHEEASTAGRAAHQRACEVFGERSPAAVIAARRLAMALADRGRELDLALNLAIAACPGEPQHAEDVPDFLNAVVTLLRVQLKRGEAQYAVRSAELARRAVGYSPGGAVGAELQLWGAHAEALTAVGAVKQASELFRDAIRQLRKTEHEFVSELIPLYEGLALSLPKSERAEAVWAKESAAALRARITGRPKAPIPSFQTAAESHWHVGIGPWPRRALSGVVSVSGVEAEALDRMVAYLGRPSTGFGVIQTVRREGSAEVTLVLEGWEDPFEQQRALRNRSFVDRLTDSLRGVVAARGDILGDGLKVLPWWSFEDSVPFAWWVMAGIEEQWRRELFPALPGWIADPNACRWLGAGIERGLDERVAFVSPLIVLELLPGKGVAFSGRAPAEQLDDWFTALARATEILPPRLYAPFSRPMR